MSTYSLGSATFCLLRRNDQHGHAPELLMETKTILSRPGVNGISVRREGKKGLPFQMISLRDCEDQSDADALIAFYKTMEDSGTAVALVWNSVNYQTQYGVKYIPLRVHETEIRAVANVAGPMKITSNPTLIVGCTWDLVPVEA